MNNDFRLLDSVWKLNIKINRETNAKNIEFITTLSILAVSDQII